MKPNHKHNIPMHQNLSIFLHAFISVKNNLWVTQMKSWKYSRKQIIRTKNNVMLSKIKDKYGYWKFIRFL